MEAAGAIVKLINTADQILVNRELVSSRSLRSLEVEAELNPELLTLVLPLAIVQKMGLKIWRQQTTQTPSGQNICVGITEPVTVEHEGQKITLEALVAGDRVCLGQVVLHFLKLLPDYVQSPLLPTSLDWSQVGSPES